MTSVATARPRLAIDGDACARDELAVRVRVLVGGGDGEPQRGGSVAHVTLAVRAGEVVGTVAIGDDVRTIRAATCAEAIDALALIVALAMSAHADDPPAVPTGPPRAEPHALRAPEARPRTPWGWFGGLSGSRTAGGWTPRLELGARWRRGAQSLGVEASAALPQVAPITADSDVRVWDLAATVAPCVHRGGVAACALATAGALRGEGRGLIAATSATSLQVAAGARVEWVVPLTGALALRLHLDAQAYLTTTRFSVDHMPVWDHDRVVVHGGAGVLASIP